MLVFVMVFVSRFGYATENCSNRACKSRARKRGWGQLGAGDPYTPC